MPVVTALVMCTQDEYNKLANAMNEENVEEGDTAEQAFIVGELLRLSVNLDYADETGRRAMHDLTRMSYIPLFRAGIAGLKLTIAQER